MPLLIVLLAVVVVVGVAYRNAEAGIIVGILLVVLLALTSDLWWRQWGHW